MNNKHFDSWSKTYDQDVKLSNERNSYPFAGYDQIMEQITNTIYKKTGTSILDIGIGTATLCKKLYDSGYNITGTDFSEEMLKIAEGKMPNANFVVWDFTQELPNAIKNKKYDFIIFTYTIHHIQDDDKVKLLKNLSELLNTDGTIIIGDVSFNNKNELEACKNKHVDIWDTDEFYLSAEYISNNLGEKFIVSYNQVSYCSGIMMIQKDS